ncbi:MAG: efflux RND transporter periplasmic adaptor subunit [Planctomycetota bacterium]
MNKIICLPSALALLAWGVAGLLLLGLSNCGGDSKTAMSEKKKDDKSQIRRYPVSTAKVSVRPLQYTLDTTGSLQAEDIFRIDAQVSGVIREVAFKEGSEVTPQTVLCRIAPTSYALAAQRAKDAWQKSKDAAQKARDDLDDIKRQRRNEVERLRLKMDQAERDVKRRQSAFESHAISEDEFLLVVDKRDNTNIELKDAREAVITLVKAAQSLATQKESEAKQSETEWKQSEDDLLKSAVVSPVSGIIDARYISNGAQVSAGAPIAQIVSQGLKLRFALSEQESAHVSEKSRLTFRTLAYPGRDFNAIIYYISRAADPKTRLVTCWANVESVDAVLKSGFFTTIKIVTKNKNTAVVIPLTAAQPTEYGFVVYVVESDKSAAEGKSSELRAQRRKVTLGLQVADQAVEVIDGLKEGESLVTTGADALQDGVLVKTVDITTELNHR